MKTLSMCFCVYLTICLCTIYVQAPSEQIRDTRFHEIGVIDGC